YIDPPFNTGRMQQRTRLMTRRDAGGDRTGFGGRRYSTTALGSERFADAFDDYLGFLEPRRLEAKRLLRTAGSLFVHLDAREVHYVKVLLDGMFGRASFMNEIVWAYDYGGRSRTKWAQKHDTILWYARDPARYTFRPSESDRLPYMAPGLVTPEKRARGKLPTDTWWNTIVSPTGKEETGYPTQKPLAIRERIVRRCGGPSCKGGDAGRFERGGDAGHEEAIRGARGQIREDTSVTQVVALPLLLVLDVNRSRMQPEYLRDRRSGAVIAGLVKLLPSRKLHRLRLDPLSERVLLEVGRPESIHVHHDLHARIEIDLLRV